MDTCSFSDRRQCLRLAGAAAAAGLGGGWVSTGWAQPATDTLRILCSGPAGSIPDTVARKVAERLSGRAARTVVVENRPGAAGQIAVAALKSSPADGSTLLLAQGAIATVYPALYPKLAYDPAVDLAPVSLASEMTLALAVGPLVPATVLSVEGLVGWMRANPKLANVGSPGTGTLPHLLEAMLFHEAAVPWQHIAYSGGPPALTDLMGGQIAVLVLPEGLLRQHAASGRLRLLATSAEARTAYLPEVPSLAEQGHPKLVLREWFGFFMSGRTAQERIDARSNTLQAALGSPELGAAFAELAMTAAWSTPSAMAARIAAEQRVWAPLIHAAGIRAE